MGFSGGASGKEPTGQCRRRRKRHGFDPQVRKIPWRRAQQPTPVFLPGESHGQRSPGGYSPQGHTESDMTQHKHTKIYCTTQEIQLLFDNNFKWNKFIKVLNHYAINLNYYNIVNQVYLNKTKRKTKLFET